MSVFRRHLDILCNYRDDYAAQGVRALGNAGGCSGAAFWKVHGKDGDYCLRRWAAQYPTQERLDFIHAVQWHAKAEGFTKFAMPVETLEGMTYVADGDSFWQLEPWMEGTADFRKHPGTARLVNAMTALAEFHSAMETFPVENEKGTAPALLEHERILLKWTESQLDRLENAICDPKRNFNADLQSVRFISGLSDSEGPAGVDCWQIGNAVTIPYRAKLRFQTRLQAAASELLLVIRKLRMSVLAQVVRVSNFALPLLPCIHDLHSAHLYFKGQNFRGFIDFGSAGVDSPAVDVARLLNTLTESRPVHWLAGLAAYQSVRPLYREELAALQVFRRSTALTTAIRWLEYIFMQNHPVKCSARLVRQLEKMTEMLERV
ncbi:MAG: phosphotransferase [Thermoguttaceae bacterium]|nr:phosphotransferase [Thermoguttaceae bacterium]